MTLAILRCAQDRRRRRSDESPVLRRLAPVQRRGRQGYSQVVTMTMTMLRVTRRAAAIMAAERGRSDMGSKKGGGCGL